MSVSLGVEKGSLKKIAEQSVQIKINQGQTLIRSGCIETHAFILLKGSLRLLGNSVSKEDLFTVGKVNVGEIVGLVDLLRQSAAKQ